MAIQMYSEKQIANVLTAPFSSSQKITTLMRKHNLSIKESFIDRLLNDVITPLFKNNNFSLYDLNVAINQKRLQLYSAVTAFSQIHP